jgi:hypothetical protein
MAKRLPLLTQSETVRLEANTRDRDSAFAINFVRSQSSALKGRIVATLIAAGYRVKVAEFAYAGVTIDGRFVSERDLVEEFERLRVRPETFPVYNRDGRLVRVTVPE